MPEDHGTHLTDIAYWDKIWADRAAPDPLDPAKPGLNNAVPHAFHRLFSRTFDLMGIQPGNSIVEVGCGGSTMLPYFTKTFGLRAEGIDSSPKGCALSDAIARKSGINTPIHQVDMFDLPTNLQGCFDIVFSAGLVEHFQPTTLAVDALAKLVRPGGHVVTTVPNMRGLVGFIQKYVDRDVYNLHVPLSATDLAAAHRASGLDVIDGGYLMTVNFGVIAASGESSDISRRVRERLTSWASKSVWLLEQFGFPELPNPITSPYAYTIARMPR
jgi:2-polyprenyl-3-methyl-5-hydroxy-6-metoxy-1,4-benzoquinol methylase